MKLKLREVLQLEAELNGLSITYGDGRPSEEAFRGMLGQPIGLKVKYHLNRINSEVRKEKEIYDKIQIELQKKFTKEVDGKLEITDKDSLDKEYKELLEQEVDLQVDEIKNKISIDDFADLKTDYNYPAIFGLLD